QNESAGCIRFCRHGRAEKPPSRSMHRTSHLTVSRPRLCSPLERITLFERGGSMMRLKVGREDTWAASIEDKPGGLSAKRNALANAGVNLEFIIARREPAQPGTGVVFVTPIKGAAGARAARQAGFAKSESLHAVRIEGPDRPGQGAK